MTPTKDAHNILSFARLHREPFFVQDGIFSRLEYRDRGVMHHIDHVPENVEALPW